jgi:hypothetical protein
LVGGLLLVHHHCLFPIFLPISAWRLNAHLAVIQTARVEGINGYLDLAKAVKVHKGVINEVDGHFFIIIDDVVLVDQKALLLPSHDLFS